MTSNNVPWFVILAFVFAFARAEVTLSDLSGVWTAFFDVEIINVFTPQGQAFLCRDTLSMECKEEIPPIQDTYTFNKTTLSLKVQGRIGVTDAEKSAALYPSCAKDGIFPAENIITRPPSKILSYDSEAERIYYIDPRRPDDVNCLPARYRVGEKGPYIEVTHALVYKGPLSKALVLGASFRCELPPQTCRIELNVEKGELDMAVQASFNLTCVAGDCLNAFQASPPSIAFSHNESPIDV
eukprot:g8471.t1